MVPFVDALNGDRAFDLETFPVPGVKLVVPEVPFQRLPLIRNVYGFDSHLTLVHVVVVGNFQAQPAELVLALSAPHVVAPPVLFDLSFALRTLFGVGADPVSGLAVVIALFDPLFKHVAIQRVVPSPLTVEAAFVSLGAFYVAVFVKFFTPEQSVPGHQAVFLLLST